MAEGALKWMPVSEIAEGFGSISFSYEPTETRSLLVVMHGQRELSLRFSRVIALHYEDECPGFFPLPGPLPMLKELVTFPLLRIENSSWAKQWTMYSDLTHFALISSDDLVHLLASPVVDARWTS